MPETLTSSVTEAQHFLTERLNEVITGSLRPRERQEHVDRFVSSAMRHLGALRAVILREMKGKLPKEDAANLNSACDKLEQELWSLDATMRGSALGPRIGSAKVWEAVTTRFQELLDQESGIVARLSELLPTPDSERLAERITHAETHAPTRPHPYLPQHGVTGKFMRGIASHTDAFWDAVTGRITVHQAPSAHTA